MSDLKEGRGYGLGERNPATLPDGSNSRESHFENIRSTKKWKLVRAQAMIPGGKY